MDKPKQSDALFLPFLQMPSGHHHVADTLITDLLHYNNNKRTNKVELLSYSYGSLEKIVTSTYISWIKRFPGVYDRLYTLLACRNMSKRKRHRHYELLFRPFLNKLVKEENPEIVFLTHALPSSIVSVLKQENKLQAVTVNAYTDFFVNRLWGIKGIDYHFVPTASVKKFLLKLGVKAERIFITGIPVHPVFREEFSLKEKKQALLITGGSLGSCGMDELLSDKHLPKKMHLYVLCGTNEQLYQTLSKQNNSNITPIPYIESKAQMNKLYNEVDAVLTKPGGVTISECLMKRKPIFVYHALPGQEQINLQELIQLGLVNPIDLNKEPLEEQINQFFLDTQKKNRYTENVNRYHQNLSTQSIGALIQQVMNQSQ
ncbi:MAG: MGDG synthase family glycosyltransferase [Bacillota bacterium]|uniref:UDP-glucuronosyltransferase n=2 Tax=Virgibacillus salarius TaxID=447199 RepID=A0A941DYZ4_9BACI|nr:MULTISPECIES: glycosyltransferase [Virgibacillus]NAZ10379.1 UDP-glucuronosyltransferase [Agaribacter marinus]MBR7797669.1 UDP-glucuronosyltransferase [Virgibacillus salarius]MCC2251074.1 UDP-glucuronosyltransferase [Virgibacillus sp. AGTR]MDY7042896.1 glycosyltransferase [Virgibacillus sp. M23]QRZ18012.1 UDP-glucuronosyltransferase [Virgibacillus sp. AGTR]